jgi:hypothetical protein
MYNRQMEFYKPNFRKQRALYSRELSNGEIGCSISHQKIQDQYKDSNESIIILEDDARINDIKLFETISSQFAEKYRDEDAVLSLLPWRDSKSKTSRELGAPKVNRLLGKSPLTVGYVITPKAMKSLSIANTDYAYLPDWPPTQTKFYVTKSGLIQHGDSSTVSLIDQTGRKKTARLVSLVKFSMLPYFLNSQEFSGITEYINFAIKPTLTWRIDKLRIR